MSTRELEFEDAPALLAWVQDPEGSRYFMGDAAGLTLEDLEAFILSARITQGEIHLAVTDGEDRLIGLVSLKQVDLVKKQGEFSIGLRPAAQGRGLARAAARDLLGMAFETLGLECVYMYTDPANQATRTFNERCGFQPLPGPPDGIRPDPTAPRVWYGLTRSAYRQLQAEKAGLFRERF